MDDHDEGDALCSVMLIILIMNRTCTDWFKIDPYVCVDQLMNHYFSREAFMMLTDE